jgi:hypothetical protein
MMLREIQNILLQADFENGQLHYQKLNNITNIHNFKAFVDVLNGTSMYQDTIRELMQSEIYRTSSNTLNIENDKERKAIFTAAAYLSNSAYELLKVSECILDSLGAEAISIRMADEKDFGRLVSDIDNIYKVISQLILNEKINGKFIINSWGTGSRWINLNLGTVLAVTIVAHVVRAGEVVYKKVKEGKIFCEYARGLSLKCEALDEITNKQSELLNQLVNEEAKKIQEEFYDADKDNEYLERIKCSIKIFSELIERSTEIYPAPATPEDVKNLFPDFDKLELITSKKTPMTLINVNILANQGGLTEFDSSGNMSQKTFDSRSDRMFLGKE